ncbi:acetyltransferase [Marinobacter adhaerens]|uniref:Transferase n=1 Tax=Marinobacter salsuginis TaxID=418719 RepID=A0A5M3PIM5_9GAMM|nr:MULTISPECIES: acyltransferase [Marinobacter]ODM32277.1 acetyltransferase [Marinobacter adhaerens]QTN40582.1 acyltransferase [Marinobacter salsuginis]GBO82753.1 transferase [Marinobacter salsuginis]|tara:strand:- start:12510 stop:13130 length:621 start_codon:yes stop_codon:yes gene_type:complete
MKSQIKTLARIIFTLLASPLWLVYRGFSIIGNQDSVFQSVSQLLSLVPGKPGIYLRASFYSLACPNTSSEISIGFLTVLSHWDTTIERGVYVGPQCNIGKCFIGENTLLGSGVHVLSGSKQHEFNDPQRPIQEQGGTFTKIRIGRDCWLGNTSVVMSDIGDHSIVAAGAIVTRATPPGCIVAGNPAKKVRSRFSEQPSGSQGENEN